MSIRTQASGATAEAAARETLALPSYPELGEERRRSAHRRLGQFLLASEDVSELERLKGGVHLLLGGDEDAGSRAVAAAGKHYGLVDLADLGAHTINVVNGSQLNGSIVTGGLGGAQPGGQLRAQ